jgi:serpin B
MAKVLRFRMGQERTHAAFEELNRRLGVDDPSLGLELRAANSLWGQRGYPFQPDFLDLVSRHYGGAFREVDFTKDPQGVRRQINDWVRKETKDKIAGLLGDSHPVASIRLLLANAVYFNGRWSVPFPKDATKTGPFETASGRIVDMPMMHWKECTLKRMA